VESRSVSVKPGVRSSKHRTLRPPAGGRQSKRGSSA
jgi:hypothetical protein